MDSRTEEILQAMIDNNDSSQLQAPASRVEELLIQILDKMNDGSGGDEPIIPDGAWDVVVSGKTLMFVPST